MSTITNSTNRVAGLISGLETEELVKAMTANTKMRINSQKQKIQTLQWKQEAYRSIISKITSFQSKYLDLLSSTSLKANAVMKKYVSTTSNDKYVTASASSNASAAKYTISKTTAATTASVTSNGSVAAGTVKLDFSKAKEGETYTVEVNLDGASKKITFDGGSSASVTQQHFLDALNEAFEGTMGKGHFSFEKDSTSLYFNNMSDGITHTFSVGYCSEGLGLDNTAYNRISTGLTLAEAGFATELKTSTGTYDITINGVDFSFKADTTIAQMMSTINNSNAGVKMSFSNISQTFTIETKETGASAQLSVTQSSGNLLNAMFGLDEDVAEPKEADHTFIWGTVYSEKASPKQLGDDLVNKLKNGFGDDESGTYKVKYTDAKGNEYQLELDLKTALNNLEKGEDGYTPAQISEAFNTAIQDAYKKAYREANPDLEEDAEIADIKVEFEYTESKDKDGKTVGTLTFTTDGTGVDFRTNAKSTSLSTAISEKLKKGFPESEDGETGIYNMKYTDGNGKTYDLELDLKSAFLDENGNKIKPENEDGTYSNKQISEAFNKAVQDAYRKAYKKENPEATEEEIEALEDIEVKFTYGEVTDRDGNTSITLSVDVDGCGVEFDEGEFKDLNIYDENKDFNLLNNRTITNAPNSYIVSTAEEMTFKVDTATGESEIKITRDGNNITITRDGEIIYSGENEKAGISIQNLVDAGLFKANNGYLTAIKDMTAVDDGAKAFLEEQFSKYIDPETGDYSLEKAKIGELEVAHGTNSTITISSDDGKTFSTYTSASNSFTFDGTTITISGDFEAAGTDDCITVETKKDTSSIKDVITGFIEDYNNLLADLYGEITTQRPKSSGAYYDPLTEEQEEEMSDKQIENWNDNAKKGLLYQDSNIQKFLSELRGVMNTRVDGFGLADLGIRLTDSWNDRGKLEIKDEAKLESAIEALGDKVANLFTGENGLAAKLEGVIDKAVSTKTKKYGYLSGLAGIEGTKTDTDNQLYKQIDYIQKIIERLNTKYENEQERYWRKYSQLETMMQRAQTQMSYFMDYGSGGY